jgi:hypothetical protein
MDSIILADKFTNLYGINVEENNGLDIIEQCVKKISEEYPKLLNSYIETIADQSLYQVTHEGMMRVSKVYYSTLPSSSDVMVSDPLANSRSLSFRFTEVYEKEISNRLSPVDANIVNFDSFELIPAPTIADAKVYYEYEAYRQLSDIPEIFEEDIFNLFFFYERENEFRKTMRNNAGNVFAFDRRGNIQAGAAGGSDPMVSREVEMKMIMKHLRNTVMKLRR